MKTIFEFFKGIVDWILDKMKSEGAKHTMVSVLIGIVILFSLSVWQGKVVQQIGENWDQNTKELIEEHKELYLASRDMYSQIKSVMRAERPVTKADYILLLEYHNGSENIVTGYQFCKFDITIEELSDSVPYIQIDNFKDENLYKYDILLSDRVTRSKMSSFSLEEIAGMDRNLMYTLHPNDHTQYIVFYNIMHNKMCAGTLMFMYGDENNIDYSAITTCGADIENIIDEAMTKHDRYLEQRSQAKKHK